MQNTDLRIRTKDFALRILTLFAALQKNEAARIIGKQLIRSGTSVGANYREASRSRSKAEFIAKAGDSLKELDETSFWLELLDESGLVSGKRLAALRKECDELIAIFVTITKNARKPAEAVK